MNITIKKLKIKFQKIKREKVAMLLGTTCTEDNVRATSSSAELPPTGGC